MDKFIINLMIFIVIVFGIITITGIIIGLILTKVALNIEIKNKKKYILDDSIPPEDIRKIRIKIASYLNIDLSEYGGTDSKFIHALELFNVRTLEIKKDEPHIYDLIVRDIFGEYRHKFNI